MATELYKDANHLILAFDDLVTGDGLQSNQFLIIHDDCSALIDPGGNLTYTPLYMQVVRYTSVKALDYVIASHQDPDIISSLDKWLNTTDCKIVCSKLWLRFLPHLATSNVAASAKAGANKTTDRYLPLPDKGMDIPMGDTVLKAVPAHFLHSVGNFQFYDPISKILFSGDMGASMMTSGTHETVTDFDAHIDTMLGFHQRYMVSNKICRLWANMVRTMDVEMIVPQHGQPFKGKQMINQFLDWISELECGIDRMEQEDFVVP